MHIKDARTGRLTPIKAVQGSLLRVAVHTASTPRQFPLGDLRALVVADVLFRTLELDGVQVMVGHADGALPQTAHAREHACAALGIGPPAVHAEPEGLHQAFGAAPDIDVVAAGADAPSHPGGVRMEVGTIHGPSPTFPAADTTDHLALRLALLRLPYAAPAELSPSELTSAHQHLTRWRRQVAGWAQAVSRPMHQETAQKLHAAFHDDLDTATALGLLAHLESEPGSPDGATFETFLHADRVLALELPHDIGRL